MTPRRTGGSNEAKREGFEIKSEAENVASAFMLYREKQAALRVARVPLRDMAAEWLVTPKAGVKGLARDRWLGGSRMEGERPAEIFCHS